MGKSYKNRMTIEFEGFDEVIAKMYKLEGNVKETTERGLKKTHEIITAKAQEAVQKPNLPAKGRYSTGTTEKMLKTDADVYWEGTVAKVPVGFKIHKHDGLPSLFMIYGTPRYMKNQKMYNAFWSSKTHNEVIEAQKEIFYEELRKLEGL